MSIDALSSHFRRDVRLAQVAPDDFTIDIYHPNVEGADPSGHRSYARKVLVVLTACCGWDRRNARAEN